MKRLLFFALTFLSIQQYSNSQSIQPGQSVPNIQFTGRIGNSQFEAKLSDWKEKYIILDFWNKSCIDCIAQMPKLLALQQKFRDKLVILLVTKNSREEVDAVFRRFSTDTKTRAWIEAMHRLPIISNDSILSTYFPYNAVPVTAWIKDSLKFYGMAYSTSVSEQNIQDWTSGIGIKLDEYAIRPIDPFDPTTLLQAARYNTIQRQFYSILLNRIEFGEGVTARTIPITDSNTGKQIGVTCLNMTISELYKSAYKNTLGLIVPNYRILWNISEKFELFRPRQNFDSSEENNYYDWAKKNTFCYSIKTGSNFNQDFYQIMQIDLDNWFGFNSKVENVMVKCWVLKQISESDSSKIVSKKIPLHFKEHVRTDSELIIKDGLTFEQLYLSLKVILNEAKWEERPFVNDVKYRGPVNIWIEFRNGLSNVSFEELNQHLKVYGLKIVEEYRCEKMLMISDRMQTCKNGQELINQKDQLTPD